ncbi:pyridoxamine 5'-phosphate oxidase [Chloroherpeton thalassium ATCC 35110]|uniref:Pyridoxamine 5'-phosphate oxidase n=1 Tax=Chloroherpeton thalassium (strain ATCC 35110 / GB-78) TaxID=517418 RepID=B3QVM1_CHLT3|nr:pyridoxamine 5'-phosphate oxidase [Chloroherpeton thalassium]ACF13078.1 pyridoxamine 5'-phosphate oxidase [Chloroherpeton thalassium ATCC 35110]
MTLAEKRKEYGEKNLARGDLASDPISQFGVWLQQAIDTNLSEPNAMTLATVGKSAKPTARTVLLKGFDHRGFFFFTNYESRKGQDLSENPYAAIVFFWRELERQVTATGKVSKISREESAEYFAKRPLGSRLGAWASRQSTPIETRDILEARFDAYQKQFGEAVPLPDFWGGFCLEPETVEFWQGRANRLHDRFQYARIAPEIWKLERLSP